MGKKGLEKRQKQKASRAVGKPLLKSRGELNQEKVVGGCEARLRIRLDKMVDSSE